jgi:hypothetical protein
MTKVFAVFVVVLMLGSWEYMMVQVFYSEYKQVELGIFVVSEGKSCCVVLAAQLFTIASSSTRPLYRTWYCTAFAYLVHTFTIRYFKEQTKCLREQPIKISKPIRYFREEAISEGI